MKISEIYARIEAKNPKAQWRKACREYALEMLDKIIIGDFAPLSGESDFSEIGPSDLLNHVGARGLAWDSPKLPGIAREASFGGNFLVYNGDLAERLLSPTAYRVATHRRDGLDGEALLCSQAKALLGAIGLIREAAGAK